MGEIMLARGVIEHQMSQLEGSSHQGTWGSILNSTSSTYLLNFPRALSGIRSDSSSTMRMSVSNRTPRFFLVERRPSSLVTLNESSWEMYIVSFRSEG